eukprot:5934549-Pleurochrysis_carterae.AAC.1
MTVEEHPSPGGSHMVKTYTVRPKVFYGETDPNEAPRRRPTSFPDRLLCSSLEPPPWAQPALGSPSLTLALKPPPWLHLLGQSTDSVNSPSQANAWPPSLPPSPPASESNGVERLPSQPQVSSARVTRFQSRAREAAGLQSLSRKQPRLASPPLSSLTPEPDSPFDDSNEPSLLHPGGRSFDGLSSPDSGADGAGSSAYHSAIPPIASGAGSDRSITPSPDPWLDPVGAAAHYAAEELRSVNRPPDRIYIVRPRSPSETSSSPDDVAGPLPSTPFGLEPPGCVGYI